MSSLLTLVAWCLLSLPLRLIGVSVAALWAVLGVVSMLPTRVLGHRPKA